MNKLFEELYLIAVMDRKHSPWSQQQTFSERAQMLQDEVEEIMEAIKSQDPENLREELGDVIWDALTIAAIAEEKGLFTPDEILNHTISKIKLRKPHIFTGEKVPIEEESRRWMEAKLKDKLA